MEAVSYVRYLFFVVRGKTVIMSDHRIGDFENLELQVGAVDSFGNLSLHQWRKFLRSVQQELQAALRSK